MTIIDRYLLRQVALSFGGIILILSTLFVTFTLARFLTDASAGVLQLSEVFHVTLLRWLIAQDVLIPISLYLSVILVWGRLYQELEMGALAAGGVGTLRLVRPMLLLAVLLALIVALCSLWLRPWAWYQVYQIKAEAEASAEIDRIKSERFNLYAGERTIFIEKILPGNKLEGVFIRRKKDATFELLAAPRGLFTPYVNDTSHQLTLFDAMAFGTFEEGPELYGKFATLTLNIEAATPRAVRDLPKVKASRQLLSSDLNQDRAELQWRYATPISTLLLLLIAVPLARTGPRRGRYGGLILALIIYAVYFNLISVVRTWVENGQLPYLGWVHGLLFVLAAMLWWRGPLRR